MDEGERRSKLIRGIDFVWYPPRKEKFLRGYWLALNIFLTPYRAIYVFPPREGQIKFTTVFYQPDNISDLKKIQLGEEMGRFVGTENLVWEKARDWVTGK